MSKAAALKVIGKDATGDSLVGEEGGGGVGVSGPEPAGSRASCQRHQGQNLFETAVLAGSVGRLSWPEQHSHSTNKTIP